MVDSLLEVRAAAANLQKQQMSGHARPFLQGVNIATYVVRKMTSAARKNGLRMSYVTSKNGRKAFIINNLRRIIRAIKNEGILVATTMIRPKLPAQKRILRMCPNLVMLAAGYGMLVLSYAFIARPLKMVHPF
jgi:hypothetical protein